MSSIGRCRTPCGRPFPPAERPALGDALPLRRMDAAEIRAEEPRWIPGIRAVNLAAFPGPAEADVVDALRSSSAWLPAYSLAAERDQRVLGHVLLSRAALLSPAGDQLPILALGPMAVLTEEQGRGLGSALVESAIVRAAASGEDLIVVLGHAWFYPRFGFRPARPMGIEPPLPWPDAAWMALPLTVRGGLLRGQVRYPAAFDAL